MVCGKPFDFGPPGAPPGAWAARNEYEIVYTVDIWSPSILNEKLTVDIMTNTGDNEATVNQLTAIVGLGDGLAQYLSGLSP